FDYGSIVPWVRSVDGVLHAVGGPDGVALVTDVGTEGLDLDGVRRTVAEFEIGEHEELTFNLGWFPSHEWYEDDLDAAAGTANTEMWWRAWCSRSTYDGQWPELVQRSLLTLKAL